MDSNNGQELPFPPIPTIEKEASFKCWKDAVRKWSRLTDVKAEEQALSVVATLAGKAKEFELELTHADLKKETGLETLLTRLDARIGRFEDYRSFQILDARQKSTFEWMLSYVEEFKKLYMDAADRGILKHVFAFKLLNGSGLSQAQQEEILNSCEDITVNEISARLLNVSPFSVGNPTVPNLNSSPDSSPGIRATQQTSTTGLLEVDKKPEKWICPACFIANEPSDSACYSCNTTNPNAPKNGANTESVCSVLNPNQKFFAFRTPTTTISAKEIEFANNYEHIAKPTIDVSFNSTEGTKYNFGSAQGFRVGTHERINAQATFSPVFAFTSPAKESLNKPEFASTHSVRQGECTGKIDPQYRFGENSDFGRLGKSIPNIPTISDANKSVEEEDIAVDEYVGDAANSITKPSDASSSGEGLLFGSRLQGNQQTFESLVSGMGNLGFRKDSSFQFPGAGQAIFQTQTPRDSGDSQQVPTNYNRDVVFGTVLNAPPPVFEEKDCKAKERVGNPPIPALNSSPDGANTESVSSVLNPNQKFFTFGTPATTTSAKKIGRNEIQLWHHGTFSSGDAREKQCTSDSM